jgi:hypothetical protein
VFVFLSGSFVSTVLACVASRLCSNNWYTELGREAFGSGAMGDQSPTKNSDAGKGGGSGGGKYTPPSKRLGAGGSEEGAIVVRAASRVAVPVQYPQLTDTNYALWAVKMKVLLRPHGVSSALEPEGEVDDDKDAAAFAAISQAVPDAVMMAIAGCKTAREVWETIRCMRIGEDRVKKARVKQLKRQLDRIEMDDGETVTVFAQKLTMLVGEIRSLGENISDEAVIEHLFSAVPDRFSDIVNTIEQWGQRRREADAGFTRPAGGVGP